MERHRIDLRDMSDPLPTAGLRFKSLLFSLSLVLALYAASYYIPVGWFTYFLTVPALAIIIISAGIRASEMTSDMTSTRWAVKRNGYILTGLFAVGQLVGPIKGLMVGELTDWPTWRTVIGVWGFALVWLATANERPWLAWVWHEVNDFPKHNRPT